MKNNLYILIGVPGVGKSTIAKKLLNENDNICLLSSDNIREEFNLIAPTDKNNKEVFRILHKRLFKSLINDKKDVIYDATNLSRKKRQHLYNQLKKHDVNVIAYCILKPLETILLQNNNRSGWKKVPEDVIIRMYKSFTPPRINVDCNQIFIEGQFHLFTDEIYKTIDISHHNPYHKETIREHIDFTIANSKTNQLKEIAMFHDLGKSVCRINNIKDNDFVNKFKKINNNVYHSFYNHQNVSAMYYLAYINEQPKIENKIPNYYLENLEVIFLHMTPELTQKTIDKYKLTEYEIKLIKDFHEVDKKSSVKFTEMF